MKHIPSLPTGSVELIESNTTICANCEWKNELSQFSPRQERMSDIVDILGIDKSEETPKEGKKPKKEAKKDPYAKLPRYLRDLVDESNPPPEFVFEEKKSIVLGFRWVWRDCDIERTSSEMVL